MSSALCRWTVFLVTLFALGSGTAVGEIITVQPVQEGHATTDAGGHVVYFTAGSGVGDSTDGRYIRALFTFDLSFLPPGSEISSAVVHTRVSALYGDPTTLGVLRAARVAETRGQPSLDIQSGWATLPVFNDPAPVAGVIARGEELSADLSSEFEGFFPSPEWNLDPGRAVIRFQFSDQTNGDDRDDFIYLQRTRLELDVLLPDPVTERPVKRHTKRCIPVVASLPGAAGTQWTTELHITARHDSATWLYFTETGADGSTSFTVRRVNLGMWETLRYGDVLPELFGLERAKGWIEVFSTDPEIAINARIANVGGDGTYGQTVPLVGESTTLRLSEIRFNDSYRKLVNLVMMDDDNRTNIGFVNLGSADATVHVIAMVPDGYFIGDTDVVLGPFEHRQIDRLETVIPEVADAGLIALSFGIDSDDSGVYEQGVAVYVSRVDNSTGDAVFVLP